MHKRVSSLLGLLAALWPTAGLAAAPADLSWVRGFNYTPASVTNEALYMQYDDQEVNRDFRYARSLNLNQARIFARYSEWKQDRSKFESSFRAVMAAAKRHNIGLMFVLAPGRQLVDLTDGMTAAQADAEARAWVTDMLAMAKGHKEVFAWDVANEPDWSGYSDNPMPDSYRQHRIDFGRRMADLVHHFDKSNLTTVGCFREKCLEEMEPYTDILSYHDYSPTVAEIDRYIDAAKSFAAKVKKPLLQTEMGCVGRGNPYDVALREYFKAHIGFYIWELMITKGWGDVHGVFYPDGSVRDPAIAAAVMGIFRKNDAGFRLENPDRESWVTRAVAAGTTWLADPHPDWNKGLEAAELEANMLQGNQLVAMRNPPVRSVAILRAGPPDIAALQALVRQYIAELMPYMGTGRQHGN
ncbi:MAG TPA: hypothetical protein VHZ32_01205 [Rhizomicrobium sp.]|nr:hypothetical protein [Rhizomicrobium sp.]